jgi:hypothetical protein
MYPHVSKCKHNKIKRKKVRKKIRKQIKYVRPKKNTSHILPR